MRMIFPALLWAACTVASAATFTLDGSLDGRDFSATWSFSDAAAGRTEAFSTTSYSGVRTTYTDPASRLDLRFADGELLAGAGGDIVLSNVEQAEAGSPLPAGLSFLARFRLASGLPYDGLYLSGLGFRNEGAATDALHSEAFATFSDRLLLVGFSAPGASRVVSSPGLAPAVPEPSQLALMLAGLSILAARRMRNLRTP